MKVSLLGSRQRLFGKSCWRVLWLDFSKMTVFVFKEDILTLLVTVRILVAQNGDIVSQVYFVSSESHFNKVHDVMFSDSRLDLLILSEPDEALDSLHQAKTDEELKFLDELEAFETNTLHLVVG